MRPHRHVKIDGEAMKCVKIPHNLGVNEKRSSCQKALDLEMAPSAHSRETTLLMLVAIDCVLSAEQCNQGQVQPLAVTIRYTLVKPHMLHMTNENRGKLKVMILSLVSWPFQNGDGQSWGHWVGDQSKKQVRSKGAENTS